MKKQHHKKRKITKARLIKGINGSISILLCLLLAPFLSVALGLVEYARYQEVIEITDEIYELTGMSALSDYDKYIHDRFGLLATSQEGTLGNGYDTLLSENAKILGKQISVSNPSIVGKMSLTNTETLRKQVVDFSELTATTAVIAEDFKLEDLLNKLQGVSQFNDIMNTVDSLSDLADALSTVVDKLEALQTSLDNLKNSVTNAVSSANTLVDKMAELYKKLGDNGVMLPEDATLEQIQTAIQSFTDTYLDDFKELYTLGKNLMDSINTIKTNLDTVKTSAEGFISAVNDAKSALDNISSTNSADSDGSVSAAATGKLGDVLSEMTDLIDGALTDIKEESINTAKDALNEIIDTALKDTGIAELATRYSEIVSGSYFSVPLSDTAKQDLIDLLKTVKKVYTEKDPADHNPEALLSGIKDYLKGKLVPNLGSINAENILDDIEGVLEDATATLTQDAGDNLVQLLTKLVNVVKGLFDLDLFYEADLNAYVNIGSATNSPYQSFLNAVGSLFTAVDDFKSSLGGLNLLGMLGAMGDMFGAIWDLMDSIFDIAGAAVTSIAELGNSIISGNVQGLYEKFLISGYMRHNLPCRLNSGTYSGGYAGGAATIKVSLAGKGLTGYDFDNIARPATYIGQSDSHTGFQGMAEAIQNLKNGYGSDTMFKGAELEYIRAGTNSEIANQIIVFFDMYFLRLLLDLPSVFMDGEVGAVAAAANVASWVVYILYIVAEPFCDTLLLVNGESVPLIRTDCWLTATGLGGFISKLGDAVLGDALKNELNSYAGEYASEDGDAEAGLTIGDATEIDYQTTMLILLLVFVDSDTQISRLQDLIELEATEYYSEQGKTFNMSRTYTVVEIGADVRFNPFFDLGHASGGSSLLPTKRITQFVGY